MAGAFTLYRHAQNFEISNGALLAASGLGQNVPDYRNPKLPIPDRVADLLKRMTVEEKLISLPADADA